MRNDSKSITQNTSSPEIVGPYASRICDAWNKSREGIIEAGRLLIEAKSSLPHGEFTAMIERELPFSMQTSQKLMSVSKDDRISNTAHVRLLPSSWGTLHELTKLDDDQFDRALSEGIIKPDMQRQDVTRFRQGGWAQAWGWADKQVNVPLNLFDIENPECAGNKLHKQIGLSAMVSFCISRHTDEIPALRLVPWADVSDSISLLTPIAQEQFDGLDIDYSGAHATTMITVISLLAQRHAGLLLKELDHRSETYDAVSPAAFNTKFKEEFEPVHAALMADLSEIGENRHV